MDKHAPLAHITELSTYTTKRVPIEIVERILDFLHDDSNALKACSLVRRAWLPTTRFHLFRSFTVFGDTEVVFFRFLSSQESTLPSGITDLRITGSGPTFWKLTNDHLEGMANLTSLRSLTLTTVDLCPLSAAEVQLLQAVCLKHLSFNYARAGSMDEFMQIPCVFSHLESLHLRNVETGTKGRTLDLGMPSTLRQLVVDSGNVFPWADVSRQIRLNSKIIDWVLRHKPVPPITTLSLETAKRSCGMIVAVLHETLEHLELKLVSEFSPDRPYPAEFDTFLDSIDLSQNHELRSLRMFVQDPTDSYEFILNFLNRLQSPVIRSIFFYIEMKQDYMATWSTFPLKALARTLSKHLDSLSEIIFELGWDYHSPLPSLLEAEQTFKDGIGYPVADLVEVRMRDQRVKTRRPI